MNKIKFYIFPILVVIVIAMIGTGCKKDFLDVNSNPNNPEKVDIKFALPSAQAYLGYTMGNQMHIVSGIWAQYWAQGPNASQYKDEDSYLYKTSDADRPWTQLYAGTLTDLDFVYTQGLIEKKNNYAAIARIMQAYTYQVITDAWGDAPFSEALDPANQTPKYDKQEDIYAGIDKMIDEGILLIDPAGVTPGSDDIIYSGDMDMWLKFANTLKLKLYLRQVYINPSISSKITDLMATATFLDDGESAVVSYTNNKLNQNPLYTTVNALGVDYNILASATSINFLDTLPDPRIADYYYANDNAGVYAGIIQGQGRQLPAPQSNGNFSYINEEIIGAVAPVILMSSWESYFLQAEANARGFGSGDGQAEYETGIQLSWENYQNSSAAVATDLATYLTHPAVDYTLAAGTEDKVELIITQKWIAMNGSQNFEAWTEFRRTDYPSFFQTSTSSVLSAGQFPRRFMWPDAEVTTNPNVPSGNVVTTKLWWDVN